LAKDIADHGQRFPIIKHDGQIVEGIQRYRACLQAKVEPVFAPYDAERYGGTEADVKAFIISANIHRRHDSKRKRAFIAALLKANPARSDRDVAKEAGSNHHTVKRGRAKEERRGTVSHVEKRTDSKGRKQPAAKPKPPSKAEQEAVEAQRQACAERIRSLTGREPQQPARTAATAAPEQSELATLRDFAVYTILNIKSGDLKLTGDPERYRRWKELKERVEPLIKG
jgi:hypothetical protein